MEPTKNVSTVLLNDSQDHVFCFVLFFNLNFSVFTKREVFVDGGSFIETYIFKGFKVSRVFELVEEPR